MSTGCVEGPCPLPLPAPSVPESGCQGCGGRSEGPVPPPPTAALGSASRRTAGVTRAGPLTA